LREGNHRGRKIAKGKPAVQRALLKFIVWDIVGKRSTRVLHLTIEDFGKKNISPLSQKNRKEVEETNSSRVSDERPC